MSYDLIMPEDKVYYCGNKERIKNELTSKDGKPHVGYVHASVVGSNRGWIVEFPDVKGCPSYIMDVSVLSKVRPGKAEKDAGPEIRVRKPKVEDEPV